MALGLSQTWLLLLLTLPALEALTGCTQPQRMPDIAKIDNHAGPTADTVRETTRKPWTH